MFVIWKMNSEDKEESFQFVKKIIFDESKAYLGR